MSNYVKSTNFTAKDSLPQGDANKVIRGSEFDTEFSAIAVAVATKSDLSAPTFTGEATFADLTATGTVNFSSATVSNLGAVTTADINGGTIDGVTIGGSSAGAGTFSSLTATTADINGGTVDGVTIGGSSAGAGTFSSLVATTADINGGTVDNAVVGGSTPAAGTFTSLVATTADIDGGTVDNATIGGTTPAAGTFSSLTATTANIDGGSIDGTVIGGATPAAVSGTTGTFSGAVSGTTGTFSGAVTGSNLNIANWDTAYGWGDHSTQGYLTSVAFTDIDAGAVTLSSETFSDVDDQIPTNAAVIDYVAATIPLISEVNDLTAAVTWATVPDAFISASSVNQHVSVEKATQTKTYTNGETSTITLSSAITSGVPVVSVTKEVPQPGLTNNTWDVASDGANYDLEDSAYSTTLTPSDASADGTFTLGTGSFAADDVGKIVSGNGGTAVILNTSGDYNLLTNFTDTSAIASGSWTLKEIVVDGDATGFALSAGAEEEGGFVYDFRNTVYTGSSFSVSSQDTIPLKIAFNTDGTKMYILGFSNDSVFQYSLSTAFDVTTASYDSVSFSVAGQETAPYALAFNSDGTKMYVAGNGNKSVYQYSLSTAFDLSTASYDSVSFSVVSQETFPTGLAFNNDGTKMYVVGNTNDSVFQYSLSTAFDVTTASYDSVSFSVASQDTGPYELAFNFNGTKMYIVGAINDTVYQYSLSTAFDLSTASYDSVSLSVAGQDTSPGGVVFNADYTKMYIIGFTNRSVFEYSLDPRFNLKAADYTGNSFNVSSQETNPKEVAFNTDGTKMYLIGVASDAVYQYTLSTAFDVTTASYDSVSFSVASQDTAPVDLTFNTDGTKMYILGLGNDSVYQYSLSTAFDLSTASYDSVSFNFSSQDTSPYGLAFNSDGTKMYMVGAINDSVFQYTLSTAFDLSTASYDSVSFNASTQDGATVSLAFNTSGTKMYIVGNVNDSVYQYTLSTAFDLSTASYDSVSLSVAGQDATPQGIAFNNDGSKMYIVGDGNDSVYEYGMGGGFSIKTVQYSGNNFSVASQDTVPLHFNFNTDGTKMYVLGFANKSVFQYTLSTAFDATTASYDSVSFNVNSQDTDPYAVAFNTNGTKMYMVGDNSNSVYQYSLSTGFDLSTASYDSVSFSVAGQDGTPLSIAFNNDGTKMYISGNVNDSVYQYSLSTAFDLSTASYTSVSLSVSGQEVTPYGIIFNPNGTKMYVVGTASDSVYQYSLSTAFDLSTASYDSVSFYIGSQAAVATAVAFNSDGTKMYVLGNSNDSVFQYNVGSTLVSTPVVYSSDYAVAVTNSGGQIDSTFWADVNSTTATESVGTGEVYYAYSTDDHVTWKVIDNTNGERSIARNNSGTWEYNSNATYGSETWASATTNSEVGALKQALSVSVNRMTGTQFGAVSDANHLTLANSLDFMIALKNANATSTSPTSDGVSINYDANALNQGAVLGTDYNWDFPTSTTVKLTSLGDYNLKVRII